MASGSAATSPSKPTTTKLPIYPQPTHDVLLYDSPYEIEKYIATARRQVTQTYNDTHSQIQGVVSRWIGVEHAVESRVKSFKDPTEPLTPGALYVGIATLTGSILTRSRSLPVRFAIPPIFLLISAHQFLPKTSHNISSYTRELEARYTPSLAEKHSIANAHARMAWDRMVDATKDGRAKVELGTVSIVDRIQELTGLKLKEAVKKGEKATTEIKDAVNRKIEEAKEEADKKEVKAKDSPKRLV